MIIMPANNTGFMVGFIAGKFPNSIGLLISPNGWRYAPEVIPYAIDNGAYYAFTNGTEWDEASFYKTLDKAADGRPPLWVACPDKVGDKDETKRLWDKHSERIEKLGFSLAFVAQDGMTPDDVPENASVVFMGGSFKWKWKALPIFAATQKRIHCGRVNSYEGLWICDDLGIESCDGTGWFRGGMNRLKPMVDYLEEKNGEGRKQKCLLKT